MAKLQDLVDKLQMKVKGYKRQAEEAVRQKIIFFVMCCVVYRLRNVNMTNSRELFIIHLTA